MTRNSPPSPDERSARSRYPGTRPFSDSADDYARFFGRTQEGEQLYLRVLSVPLLVQFGKSGLGKTSLLQASLFPRLRQKPFLPVMVRLNVSSDTLTLAVAHAIQQTCQTEGVEFFEGRRDGLWELLSTTTIWRDDLLLTPVLVFDQFEEVFTLRDAMFRAELAAELGALASGIAPARVQANRSGVPEELAGRPDVKIVISLREDYLGALEEFSAAIPGLFQERLRLEPLTEEAAREAITGPSQLTAEAGQEPYWAPRFDFEPSALDSMIDYLKGSSGVIEPFQLQLLCRHAEAIAHKKASAEKDPVTLTPADFSGSQGFASVLKNSYRDTLRKLPRSQRKRAEKLCEEGLLGASGHRLMLEEGQIRHEFGLKAETLTLLSQDRLLRREHRLESAFYEISHDRLAESIFASRRFRLSPTTRRLFWAAAFVTVVIVGGLIWLNQTTQNDRDRAESARQSAERLLGFLLGEEFLGEVRDMGLSIMLDQVRALVDRHVGADDQWAALIRGLALSNRGDLKRMQGFLAESKALFDEALKVFESSSEDSAGAREVARTHDRLAEALLDQGQVTQALSHYQAAVKAWRQVVASPDNSALATDDCASLADSLVTAGSLKATSLGETTLALKDLEEALRISSNVLFGRHTSHEECGLAADAAEPYPFAKGLEVFSRAALLRAIVLNFTEDHEGSSALATEAGILRPPSVSAQKNALTALAWRGNGRAGTPQRALDDYRTVLAEFEELRRWDPDNRLWQRERAATQLLVSAGIVACHESATKNCAPMPSLQEAQATTLDAIATFRTLAGIDQTNVSLQRDLAWAFQGYAKVRALQGSPDEAPALLAKSELSYSGCKVDAADAECLSSLGRLLGDQSDALVALKRLPEAKNTLQRSIDASLALTRAFRDNPTYVANLSEARRREAEIRRKSGDRTGATAIDRERTRLDQEYQALTEDWQKRADELNALHSARVNDGAKLFKGGDHPAALRELSAAESSMREYIRLRPTAFSGYDDLRNVYDWIQLTQEKLGHAKERGAALSASMYAAQVAAWLAPEGSQKEEMNTKLLQARRVFGIFLSETNHPDEALAMVQEEVVVAEGLVQGAPQNARYQWSLGNAKAGLGRVRRDLKKAGWEEAIRSGLIHIQRAAEIDRKNPEYAKEVDVWRAYLAEELEADGGKESAR